MADLFIRTNTPLFHSWQISVSPPSGGIFIRMSGITLLYNLLKNRGGFKDKKKERRQATAFCPELPAHKASLTVACLE
ncbi:MULTISPECIES: hypothetical protein [Enterobacterales]|uniref:hypothetical protein n=1 Tax=Enterobacterales TaxID=91347 RepID=UPI002EDA2CE7